MRGGENPRWRHVSKKPSRLPPPGGEVVASTGGGEFEPAVPEAGEKGGSPRTKYLDKIKSILFSAMLR